jgi:3',5'-nucleoside bisphosphate phosphatase
MGFARRPPGGGDDQARRDRLLRQAAQPDRVPVKPAREPKPEPLRPEIVSAAKPAAARREQAPGRQAPPTRDSAPKRAGSYRGMAGDPVIPPYPSRVDLHSHSRRSDGVLEPLDLVTAAADAGVQVLALTDHDTLAGVRELTAPGQPLLPLELLPGVEINSIALGIPQLWEGELHILGLGVDVTDEAFEAALARQRGFRLARFNRIVDRLGQLGFPIGRQADELLAGQGAAGGASLGRPQIARCLVAARYASTVDDAMQRLLMRGKPAYVPREGLGPMEAISAIRGAGGLPSLAHFADAYKRRDLVEELARFGLGGLEVHYRHFDRDTVADMTEVAAELRLVPTGGSDYHGDAETYAEAHATLFVPDEDATDLYSLLGRRHLTIRTQVAGT